MKKLKVEYWTGVYKPSLRAYRSERVEAIAEKISEKRVKIISASLEKASSKRQQFNVNFVAGLEEGKIKNISALNVIEEL